MKPQFMKSWLWNWGECVGVLLLLIFFGLLGVSVGWGMATKQVGTIYKKIGNIYQQELGREPTLNETMYIYSQTCSFDYSDSEDKPGCKTIETHIKGLKRESN